MLVSWCESLWLYLWGPVVFNEFGPLNAAFVSVVRQTLKILVYLTVSYTLFTEVISFVFIYYYILAGSYFVFAWFHEDDDYLKTLKVSFFWVVKH